MAVFKGDCTLLIDSGVGTRRYSLRTENVNGAGANRAIWEGDAGSTITLFFRNETTGVAPGDADTAFELLVYYETGTGTLVKTLHSAATPPANGTSYTLHLTANGDAGGGNRCGQLRLYIRADRNAVVAYDRNSDNNGGSGTAGTGDQGAIVSNMLVSDLAVSAYPAGAKFAYGTAADEQFTLTATHTQKYADTNNETFDLVVLSSDDATERESALDVEVGATTTTAQAFTVDDTYPTGDNGHGFRFRVNNNGLLLTTEKWTKPVANGASVTQDGTNAVKRSNFFTVNPDVTFASVTPGQTVYLREETATITFGIQNARSEALTRSMTALVKDGAGATKKTITDTGSTYGDGGTSDYAIAATDRATYDAVGEQWTLQGSVSGARFTNTPNAYSVSRKWLGGKTNGGVDNAIKTGKTAGADDATSRNRGQTLHFDGYVYNIRGILLASPTVNFNVRSTGSETYDESNDTVALASGRFQDNYAVDTDEAAGSKTLVIASQTTGAANQPRTGVGGSGNFFETNVDQTPDAVGTNHGHLVGTNVPALITSPWGGETNAFEFDGVPDLGGNAAGIHVNIAPSIGVLTADGSFKITAKIKRYRQGAGVTEAICGKWDTGVANENWLLQISGDKLALSMVNGAATIISAVGTTTLVANTLYDVEGEWTGTQLRVKVNAVQEGTTPALTALQAPNATTPMTIGRISGTTSFPFDGVIDKIELTKGGVVISRWEMDVLSTQAEWSVSSAYAVTVRTQKTATRTADPVDTSFTIGEDVIYEFAGLLDSSGDPVGGKVDMSQVNPSDSTTQSFLNVTVAADGWTPNPGQAFDSRAPAGSGWKQRATVSSDAANLGNTGTDDQDISMLSAYTANKAIITGFGAIYGVPNTLAATLGRSTAVLGDAAAPGDRLILGTAFLLNGVRTAFDASPVPAFLLARFNQALSPPKVEVLQSDFTWKNKDEVGYATYFFDFKESIEAGLEWIAQFGTAGQGVTGTNGYVTDTGLWPAGQVFMVIRAHVTSQPFYTGRSHPFSAGSARNPMDTGSIPEIKVLFDSVAGHHHIGTDSRAIGDRS